MDYLEKIVYSDQKYLRELIYAFKMNAATYQLFNHWSFVLFDIT